MAETRKVQNIAIHCVAIDFCFVIVIVHADSIVRTFGFGSSIFCPRNVDIQCIRFLRMPTSFGRFSKPNCQCIRFLQMPTSFGTFSKPKCQCIPISSLWFLITFCMLAIFGSTRPLCHCQRFGSLQSLVHCERTFYTIEPLQAWLPKRQNV